VATTQAGTALTERYRQEQVQIRNGFLAEFFSTWTLLDPFNLNRTRSAWLRAVLRIIEIYRRTRPRRPASTSATFGRSRAAWTWNRSPT
jgi:hypothetical protein